MKILTDNTSMRFLIIIPILFISTSCLKPIIGISSRTAIELDSSTIKSPAINYENVSNVSLHGKCYNLNQIKMVIGNDEYLISCQGSKWQTHQDLSTLSEGKHQVTFFGKDSTAQWIKYSEYTLLKDIMRPNQINSFLTSQVTQASSSASLKLSGGGPHIVIYTSDEYCMTPRCGALNLTLRSSVDNYTTPYYITKDTAIDSSFPNIIEKNGKLHLTYLSNRRDRAISDVIYSQLSLSNYSVLSSVNLTPDLVVSAKNPFMRQTAKGEIHLMYTSDEYCRLNSCTYSKITSRSDADNFQSPRFYGTHLNCNVTDHRFYVNPLNNKLHLIYGLTIDGTCPGSNTVYTKIDELGVQTHSRFGLPHGFTSVALAVDTQDKVSAFFSTSNGSFGCSGWKLSMKTSLNWATQIDLPNTCVLGGSYSGIEHSPRAEADENDIIHLLYSTNDRVDTNGAALSYKTSSDGYASTRNLYEDYFSITRYISVTKDSGNFQITFQGSGVNSGGIKLISSALGSTYKMISPVIQPAPKLYFHNDKLFAIYYSEEYCQQLQTCSRKNYVLEEIISGQKTFITNYTDPSIYVTNPLFVKKNSEDLLFYQSSETLLSDQSIFFKSSLDNFSANTAISNISSTLQNIIVDNNDEIKLTYTNNLGNKKTHYLETLAAVPAIMAPLESMAPQTFYHEASGRTAIIYRGNESGWLTSIRTSLDSFATYNRINGASTSTGFTAYFTPAGVVHTLSVFDPSASGKRGIVDRSETDNYATSPFLFDTAEGNVCIYNPIAKFDSLGVLHVAYSLQKNGDKFCNIWYRNSSNWNVKHQLTFNQASDNVPSYLFLQNNNKPIVCGGANFNLDCFKP